MVSPLGAASVVANALLAHVLLKEYLTRRNCIGVGLAIVGSVVISVTAPVTIIEDAENEDVNYIYVSLVQWRALIFLIMVVVASVILANPFNMKQLVSEEFRSTHIWANCMMCGLLGCITVMGAKGVSTAFTELINNKLDMWTGPDCWLTYVLVVSAVGSIVGQVNFLNRAMMVRVRLRTPRRSCRAPCCHASAKGCGGASLDGSGSGRARVWRPWDCGAGDAWNGAAELRCLRCRPGLLCSLHVVHCNDWHGAVP